MTTPPPAPVGLTIASVDVGDFDGPSGHLVVNFAAGSGVSLNNPVDSGADPGEWSVTYNDTLYVGSEFVFDGGLSLTIFFEETGSGSGLNVLNYAASPSDISDTSGAFLAAVVNYPI